MTMQVIEGGKGRHYWRPISTAPKDEMVWVWHGTGDGGYSLAWYQTTKGRWVLKDDPDYDGPDRLRLSAWHPLPEPPPLGLQKPGSK